MDLLIGDVFRNAARAVPNAVAAVDGRRTLRFGALDRAADGVVGGLREQGISRGDRVLVWNASALDVVPLFAALAKLGAVFAPMNPALAAAEARDVAAAARPALIVGEQARIETAREIAGGVPVVLLTDLDRSTVTDDEAAASDLCEGDPHVVFFTSGSTGRPKGVVLSHRVNFLRTHPGALLEPRGPMVCPYPPFHMAAWTIALQQWQARDAVIFTSATAADICAAIAEHSAARLNAIPAVWRRILEHIGDGGTLPTLRFADTGTSATPVSLLEAIARVCPNARVRVFYGSTEAGSVASLDHDDIKRKPGSVGLPGPSVEVRVDGAGELWTRGPALFEGYFEDPPATAAALVDGWYRTGDLADIDDEGYISIVGRAGDVIRTGGESVAPPEVEAVLATHPAVADVAVIGLADERWGEVVCAVAVLAAGASLTIDDLRAHCDGRLAPYKQPRRLVVVEAIPRTPATGQIQRALLQNSVLPS